MPSRYFFSYGKNMVEMFVRKCNYSFKGGDRLDVWQEGHPVNEEVQSFITRAMRDL